MPAIAPATVFESIPRNRTAQQFVSSFLRELAPNDCFDAQAVLADHPEVAATKSAVLDLALEDFCRRESAGQVVAPESFARRFNRHEASILHLLQLRQFLEANGAELSSANPNWPEVGEKLLGFELLDELGRGARSRVFLASQPSVGNRLVVLKVTPDSLTEVKALGRLSHPQIVAIHSVETDDERELSGICMPFCGRATLNDVLVAVQSGDVPDSSKTVVAAVDAINSESAVPRQRSIHPSSRYVDFVIDIGRQVASALDYTHARGICHFDIKPTNVLISSDGIARLIDFNLAATIEEHSFGGTMPYMSPEQLRRHFHFDDAAGEPEGPKSDVFSLGVLLFQLLSGQHPFRSFAHAENRRQAANELLQRQKQGPPSLRTLNSLVTRQVEAIVLACLELDPARRPDAVTLHAKLETELATFGRVSRWTLQHRRLLGRSTTAIGLLVAASLAFAVTREPEAVRAYDQAVRFEEQGDLAKAESRFNVGIDADPSQARLWFGRGKCRLELNRFEEAYQDFLKARELSGDPAAAAYAGYCLCRMQRDWKTAISLFEDAEASGFERPGLWNNLAFCYYKSGNLKRANEYLEKCFSYVFVRGESYYILALLKFHAAPITEDQQASEANQLYLDARQALADAIALGYENAEVHLDLARLNALIALRTDVPELEAIEQVNQSLHKAYSLGLDPNRVRELRPIWPVLFDQIERPSQLTSTIESPPPVVDPDWATDPASLAHSGR